MIHLLIGPPSAASDWCATAFAHVLEKHGQKCLVAPINTVDELARITLQADRKTVIALSPSLSVDAMQLIVDTKAPAVLIKLNPLVSFCEALERVDRSTPINSVRYIWNTNCVIKGIESAFDTITVNYNKLVFDPGAVLTEILVRSGYEGYEDAVKQTVEELSHLLAGTLSLDEASARERVTAALPPEELEPILYFLDYAEEQDGPNLLIPGQFFHDGVAPHGFLKGPLDLTGPSRFVFYGGYFSVPQGEWIAYVDFDLHECEPVPQFRIDIARLYQGGETMLGFTEFSASVSGRYRAAVFFRIEDPYAVIDFRMRNERAVFDGRFELQHIEVVKQADAHPRPSIEDTTLTDGTDDSLLLDNPIEDADVAPEPKATSAA